MMTKNMEGRYAKLEKIGEGSFGEVYKGFDQQDNRTVAIKIIDLEEAEDEIEDIQLEISVLSACNSPFITKYFNSFTVGYRLWIIMEYLGGGSCHDLIQAGPMGEQYIAIVVREVLNGLLYLHTDNKIHRDIKAANILLGSNGEVKLADFGVAGQLDSSSAKRNTFVGTPFWMPPEVIMQVPYGTRADIWSLGITMYEMSMQAPPHASIHPVKALLAIPKNPPPELPDDTAGRQFSRAIRQFMARCLCKEPEERATAAELLKHAFVRRARRREFLMELIARHQEWKKTCETESEPDPVEVDERGEASGTVTSNWDFTVTHKPEVLEPSATVSRAGPRVSTMQLDDILLQTALDGHTPAAENAASLRELRTLLSALSEKDPSLLDTLSHKVCASLKL